MPIPSDPSVNLSRVDAAAALTEAGFPISPATLATFGSRDVGPPYEVFGGRAVYRWDSTLAWAKGRARPARPRPATTEAA